MSKIDTTLIAILDEYEKFSDDELKRIFIRIRKPGMIVDPNNNKNLRGSIIDQKDPYINHHLMGHHLCTFLDYIIDLTNDNVEKRRLQKLITSIHGGTKLFRDEITKELNAYFDTLKPQTDTSFSSKLVEELFGPSCIG